MINKLNNYLLIRIIDDQGPRLQDLNRHRSWLCHRRTRQPRQLIHERRAEHSW